MGRFLWYRSTLSGREGDCYDELRRGILLDRDEIRVPKTEGRCLTRILEMVRLDDPMLFFLDGLRYRTVRGEDSITVLPSYTFPPKQRASLASQMEKRLSGILSHIDQGTTQEKTEAIHSFLLDNVIYDKIKKHYSHEIIGTLHHGIGVCEGIAKTAKLFCDHMEIPCIVVIGEAGKERHAWNLIYTNGCWRHYDFTFDLSASKHGYSCFRYFCLTDGECFATHGMSEYPIPNAEEKNDN